MGKSQIPILLKNLKSLILKFKSHGPNPNLKTQNPYQIPNPNFSLSVLNFGKKCVIKDIELLAAIFTSVVLVYRCCLQLKPVNSIGETTKY